MTDKVETNHDRIYAALISGDGGRLLAIKGEMDRMLIMSLFQLGAATVRADKSRFPRISESDLVDTEKKMQGLLVKV